MGPVETVRACGLTFRVPALDTGVGRGLREAGEFARAEQDLIVETCDGDLLDVGANIGAISLPVAARRPAANVVAIEAHSGLFQLLEANRAANGLANLTAVHAVAGETQGSVVAPVASLDVPGNFGASSLYAKGQPMERLRMMRADDVAPANCRFVKIDVEGFEPRVLQGARRLLDQVRPAWLVEASRDRPNATALVRDALNAAGYRLHWFFSPWTTGDLSGDVMGDTAIYACDGEPPWPMTPIGDDWPSTLAAYPYLDRYRNGL